MSQLPRTHTYRDKIRDWAITSTVHAVPQIALSKNYAVKLLWLCCLIASSYFCGKTVVNNLIDYFSYSVDTVMALDRDSQVNFPAVTICRLQICGLDSQEYVEFVRQFLAKRNITNDEGDISTALSSFQEYFLSNYNKSNLSSIFDASASSARQSIRDDLITCQYDGADCTADDFAFYELDELQKCYSFNAGRNLSGDASPIRQVRRFGKSYGLHVEFFLGLPDECKSPLSPNFGMVVFVHDATYSVWDETNGFEVMSGYETDVAVDRTRLLKLPTPYSDCVPNAGPPDPSSSQLVLDTFRVVSTYTQQTCLQLCYQGFLAARYLCFEQNLPMVNQSDLEPCPQVASSRSHSIYSYKTEFYQEKYAECLLGCPLECDSFSYAAILSNSEFPSLSYAEFLAMRKNLSVPLAKPENNIVGDEKNVWRNGFVSVNVFYKSDLMTTITERPSIEIETFISELGGTLGLFLGVSFLSFVEVIEIVLELAMIKYDKMKRRRTAVHVIHVASKPAPNLAPVVETNA